MPAKRTDVRPHLGVACAPLSPMAAADEGLVQSPGDTAAEVQEYALEKFRQPPLVSIVGAHVADDIDLEDQSRAAWTHIMEGCRNALTELDPGHPERETIAQCFRDAATCAGRLTMSP